MTSQKIYAYVCIVLGGLAIFNGLADSGEDSAYAVLGGGLFLAAGLIILDLVKKAKKE